MSKEIIVTSFEEVEKLHNKRIEEQAYQLSLLCMFKEQYKRVGVVTTS